MAVTGTLSTLTKSSGVALLVLSGLDALGIFLGHLVRFLVGHFVGLELVIKLEAADVKYQQSVGRVYILELYEKI